MTQERGNNIAAGSDSCGYSWKFRIVWTFKKNLAVSMLLSAPILPFDIFLFYQENIFSVNSSKEWSVISGTNSLVPS